jgi:RNA polymerase sigma-70 factor (ECF subfamily)
MDECHELLELMYDEHASTLFRFVLTLTRSEADTADIVQDIFLRVARKPQRVAALENPRAYLMQAAYRLVIDSRRRREVRENHAVSQGAEPLFAPTEDPDEAAFRHALAVALDTLPEDQRAAVHLKLWQGLTFEQIATVLQIPPNTAASRYRLNAGDFPSSLDALIPGYIAAIPADARVKAPVIYERLGADNYRLKFSAPVSQSSLRNTGRDFPRVWERKPTGLPH